MWILFAGAAEMFDEFIYPGSEERGFTAHMDKDCSTSIIRILNISCVIGV
jgi:hypothetical protein